MTQQADRRIIRPLLLALTGFFLGSLLAGALVAQPNPAPGPPLPVREQNLDANGWIKVHEQGTAQVTGTVDIDNFPSSIEISNFPETQNVDVTGVTPVTTGFSSDAVCAEPDQVVTFTLPATINATNLSVSESDEDEFAIYFKSPIAIAGGGVTVVGPSVFTLLDHAGDNRSVHHAFTRPVPINAIVYHCSNESDLCCATVEIVGTPGS